MIFHLQKDQQMLKEVVDFFINKFLFFLYPDMFRHMVAILRGS
jgi:hypothetical protein